MTAQVYKIGEATARSNMGQSAHVKDESEFPIRSTFLPPRPLHNEVNIQASVPSFYPCCIKQSPFLVEPAQSSINFPLASFLSIKFSPCPTTLESLLDRLNHASRHHPIHDEVRIQPSNPTQTRQIIRSARLTHAHISSLTSLTIANPLLEIRNQQQKTCAPTPTTYVTTITTHAAPTCPTATVTGDPPPNCKPLTKCGPHPDCILQQMTTVPCTPACCSKIQPTKSIKGPCPTCQTGCGIEYETVTAKCK